MAEAIFRRLLIDEGCEGNWEVDSAALGPWNVGELPDERTLAVLKKHGLSSEHRGRMVVKSDFHKFDNILCMDHENMSGLKNLQPKNGTATLQLLGYYDRTGRDDAIIEDTFHGNEKDFETAFQLVWQACSGFLESVVKT